MRYVLSSTEFDPLCPVEIDALASSERGETARRVTRVATLNGGAEFNDFGFTESDRTIRIRFVPESAAQEAAVIRLVQTYSRITVSGPDGLFLAAPQSYNPSDSASTLTLLVDRKLST
jgi:hypothetical protein